MKAGLKVHREPRWQRWLVFVPTILIAFMALGIPADTENPVRPTNVVERALERTGLAQPPPDIPVIQLEFSNRRLPFRLRFPGPTDATLREVSSFLSKSPDPPLLDRGALQMLAEVAVHFRADRINVISAYRPPIDGDNPHSRRRAIDFNVPNTLTSEVFLFCLRLRNAGCGYYRHNLFVHMDHRRGSGSWCDCSDSGELSRECSPEEREEISFRYHVRCPIP